jgi:hypothetical protein
MLEELAQQLDVRFWTEPEHNKARENDVRILVENPRKQ